MLRARPQVSRKPLGGESMTGSRLLLLSLVVPVLCGGAVRLGDRPALEAYLHELMVQVEAQIEEIAAAIPPREVERLRSEHYAWELQRDTYCADAGRNSTNELRELECLAELTSQYFDRRELEISKLPIAAQQGNEADRPPLIGVP